VKCIISERFTGGQRVSFDWWMSAEWAARDEQTILPTSTNPCMTRAAGTQGVNYINYVPSSGSEWVEPCNELDS
jgi:hypothetical protein